MPEAFQIVCLARSLTNWGHRHITGLETAAKPGAPDRWGIATVLGRLGCGDLFYTVNALGDPVFVRPCRCWCGTETIRTTNEDEGTEALDGLPSCTWAEEDHEGVTIPPFEMVPYKVTRRQGDASGHDRPRDVQPLIPSS